MSFVTKDSGKRMEFSSGMKRDTQEGKLLFHLVWDGPMLERWAGLLTRGAEKYDEGNWMKANGEAEYRRFRASAARHFHQWMRGDTDEDHAAAVIFNINGAEYVQTRMNRIVTSTKIEGRDRILYSGDMPPSAAEIAHAKDTQQQFLSGLEASPTFVVEPDGGLLAPDDTGDFEYDEARRLAEMDSHADMGGPLMLRGIFVNPPPDEQPTMSYLQDDIIAQFDKANPVDLDKCGTTDGITPLPHDFVAWTNHAVMYEPADRNAEAVERAEAGEFDGYAKPIATVLDTPHGKAMIGFDLGLGDDGSYGVIVRQSVPKAEFAYTEKATRLYGNDLYSDEQEDEPVTATEVVWRDVIAPHRKRVVADLSEQLEQMAWSIPPGTIVGVPEGCNGITFGPSLWQRFKSWVKRTFTLKPYGDWYGDRFVRGDDDEYL